MSKVILASDSKDENYILGMRIGCQEEQTYSDVGRNKSRYMVSDISNSQWKFLREISRELEYLNWAKCPQNSHKF